MHCSPRRRPPARSYPVYERMPQSPPKRPTPIFLLVHLRQEQPGVWGFARLREASWGLAGPRAGPRRAVRGLARLRGAWWGFLRLREASRGFAGLREAPPPPSAHGVCGFASASGGPDKIPSRRGAFVHEFPPGCTWRFAMFGVGAASRHLISKDILAASCVGSLACTSASLVPILEGPSASPGFAQGSFRNDARPTKRAARNSPSLFRLLCSFRSGAVHVPATCQPHAAHSPLTTLQTRFMAHTCHVLEQLVRGEGTNKPHNVDMRAHRDIFETVSKKTKRALACLKPFRGGALCEHGNPSLHFLF